jgi:tRNA modification GTPase
MDTIFAPATARGRAGIAVIRISGPDAFTALHRIAGRLPRPRQATVMRLSDGDRLLDEAIVLSFPGPSSFTGEDVVELQVHGSPAVVAALLKVLGSIPGLRSADPGEFTRRALANERLDLTQVEGLADLIDAETEAQRVQAQRVLSGVVGRMVEGWRTHLVRALALLEATIDFVDEDVPTDVGPEVCKALDAVLTDLRGAIAGVSAAERLRDGFEVAILGEPNAGKSTLLNALAGRDAAITSEVAGTTRDVIEVRMDIAGLPVTLLDTAGLREAEDRIERIGIARARDRAASADLRVILTVEGRLPDGVAPGPGDIVVGAKADLTGQGVSGLTGQGIDVLVEQIAGELSGRVARTASLTRARHELAASRALRDLESARIEVSRGSGRSEVAAEDIRAALRALEALVGRVDVEAVLDQIFASFCIGK